MSEFSTDNLTNKILWVLFAIIAIFGVIYLLKRVGII